MRMYEIKIIKPLTPDQARIKSMQDRVKRDQQAVKAERARQRLKVGRNSLLNCSIINLCQTLNNS